MAVLMALLALPAAFGDNNYQIVQTKDHVTIMTESGERAREKREAEKEKKQQ